MLGSIFGRGIAMHGSRHDDRSRTSENPATRPVATARSYRRTSRIGCVLAAALAGGTVFTSCDTRVREAVIGGSKDFLFTLLSPSNVTDLLFGSDITTDSP
jgi:hypothetical protein